MGLKRAGGSKSSGAIVEEADTLEEGVVSKYFMYETLPLSLLV